MDQIKIIRTQEDYMDALKLVEVLIESDPDRDSEAGERLALLTTLIKDYEAKQFPSEFPDPIEAIKYRMDQAGLKPSDLVPYIGTRGRVSEILSGKRPLTLDMVRALESGLGIPARVLIQKPVEKTESPFQNWDTQLVKTMEQYGYFGDKSVKKNGKEHLVSNFFGLFPQMQPAALFRKTNYRVAPRTDRNALTAWMVRVLDRARKMKVSKKYVPGTVNLNLMKEIIKLSADERGPLLAQEHLRKLGIKLLIERHLPKTHLDGATLFMDKEQPVIGLSLRHDRLDNFWFTLMHEMAHVALHYDNDIELFYDEQLQDKDGIEIDAKERAADALAEEAVLPESIWAVSNAKITPTAMATQSLANELGVHVAVIAGLVRYKHQNFYYLNKIVNDESARVRAFFPEAFKVKK